MEKKAKMFLLWVLVLGFLIMTVPAARAFAEDKYPTKPITIVCGWGAGGMMDTSIRLLSKIAEKELGQPIIVEQRTGASGVIAKTHVSKAKPDGYTLGVDVTSTYINLPHMREVPYNPLTDFTDVMTYARYTFGLSVRTDSSWTKFQDVLEYARKNPGKFTYASGGVGTTQHICMERVALKEGIKWTNIPFKSGPEAVVACLGGHTDGNIQGPADVVPHIKAGTLRLLMPLNENRWPAAPDVPSVAERYGFYGMSYLSVIAPAGLPEVIRQRLETVFKKATDEPSFEEALVRYQVEKAYLGGKEYTKLWKGQYDEMGRIIKKMGLPKK